jgi:hypothetical protein
MDGPAELVVWIDDEKRRDLFAELHHHRLSMRSMMNGALLMAFSTASNLRGAESRPFEDTQCGLGAAAMHIGVPRRGVLF